MRILMISDVYYPRVNGVSTSIHTFRAEFDKLGVESTLIAPDYNNQDKLIYDVEHDIIRVPSRRILLDPEDRLLKKKYYRQIIKFIADKQYDLIHIQTPFVAHSLGMTLNKQLSIPVIETYHTFFEEYFCHYIPFLPKSWLRFAARWLSRMQCNQLDAMVVPSSAMHDKLREYGIAADIKIIPTGVTMPEPENADGGREFRQRHNLPVDRSLLLHVGRIAFEKNIDFLIDVYTEVRKLLPEVAFLIAGEGPARSELQKKVAQMGLQKDVFFIGYLDRQAELPACYQAGDIFVFGSRTETQGLVLLEAMAMGLPVVSIAEMGTRDILLPGKGSVVAQEEVTDFAVKLIALLQDRSRRQLLAEEARVYTRDWSAGAMAARMAEFYHGLAYCGETAKGSGKASDSELAAESV